VVVIQDNTESNTTTTFKHTSTGILSNRRPVNGTPAAASGTITPDSDTTFSIGAPRLTLLATAKREAAKRGLYSKFFRGPVLGSDDGLEGDGESGNDQIRSGAVPTTIAVKEYIEMEVVEKKLKKKRKSEGRGDEDGRIERKRRKKELKEKEEKMDRKLKKANDVKPAAEGGCPGLEKMKELHKKERKKRKRELRETEMKASGVVGVETEGLGRVVKKKGGKEKRSKGKGREGKEMKFKLEDLDGEAEGNVSNPSNLEVEAERKRKLKDTIPDEAQSFLPYENIGDPTNGTTETSRKKKRKRKDYPFV